MEASRRPQWTVAFKGKDRRKHIPGFSECSTEHGGDRDGQVQGTGKKKNVDEAWHVKGANISDWVFSRLLGMLDFTVSAGSLLDRNTDSEVKIPLYHSLTVWLERFST